MTKNLIWFGAGVLAAVATAGVSGLVFLKTSANGFSARSDPSFIETAAAQQARSMALSSAVRSRPNPVPESKEVLEEAMAHWADHCAVCHGNDGSGEVEMGRQMYPHVPDMRKPGTQQLTDGELFYIVENGIRLSGMPGWGGTAAGEKDSWKLVHFIRKLPSLSASELKEMEGMNPKGPEDRQQERAEDQFLNGQTPNQPQDDMHHHKENPQ